MGKHGKHRRHPHHHAANSNSWFWFIFFILVIGVVLLFVFVPWWWRPPPPPPVKDEMMEVESEQQQGGFVFRRRGLGTIAPKRTDPARCRTGERWSAEEGMCAPIFNTPVAFEGSIMNVTMNMCDDFFNSMCGKWNAEHVNEDRTFSYGYHRNQAVIRKMILNPPGAGGSFGGAGGIQTSPLRRFYDSCMTSLRGDASAQHESELETRHVLEHIAGSLKGYADLPTVFGRLLRYGYTAPFVFSIERDPMHNRLVPFFTADSFNFSSAVVAAVFEESRTVTRITQLVLLDKVRRATKAIRFLMRHNTEPVEGIVDYLDYLRSGGLQDDMHTFRELGPWFTPHEDRGAWTLFFQALDGSALRLTPDQPVWVIGMRYMQWLLKEGLQQLEVLDWLAFVEFSIFYNARQFYPDDLPDNVYAKGMTHVRGLVPPGQRPGGTLVGTKKRLGRSSPKARSDSETLCVSITQRMLPGLVAETFLATAMPQKATIRAQVKEMIERILNVYKGIIQSTAWLSQADKDVALNKLSALIVRVIEPDEWEPEPFAQRISADRYDHNLNLVRRYRVHRNLQLWHKDNPTGIDRNEVATFVAPLSDVNAYYSPSSNTITILAGILQKPFYNVEYDEPTRYAIVGSIIGHELGHMFDPHGLYWGADGSFYPQGIWSAEGMAAFMNKTQCVVREFGEVPKECIVVPPGEAGGDEGDEGDGAFPGSAGESYGLSTLGEDMADLIGIRLSYRAYFDYASNTNQGQRQYFFMSFAQAWCSSYSVEQKCALVTGDVHAIAEYRVDRTLRNLPEWRRVFGCPKRAEGLCAVFE